MALHQQRGLAEQVATAPQFPRLLLGKYRAHNIKHPTTDRIAFSIFSPPLF